MEVTKEQKEELINWLKENFEPVNNWPTWEEAEKYDSATIENWVRNLLVYEARDNGNGGFRLEFTPADYPELDRILYYDLETDGSLAWPSYKGPWTKRRREVRKRHEIRAEFTPADYSELDRILCYDKLKTAIWSLKEFHPSSKQSEEEFIQICEELFKILHKRLREHDIKKLSSHKG